MTRTAAEPTLDEDAYELGGEDLTISLVDLIRRVEGPLGMGLAKVRCADPAPTGRPNVSPTSIAVDAAIGSREYPGFLVLDSTAIP